MGIADDMKRIAEDIVASYDLRVKALGDIVTDTRKTLAGARKTVKGFAADRKTMAEEQAKSLLGFVKDLTKNVGNMLKTFQQNHQEMSEAQAKSLSDFVKDLAKGVGSMIKGFQKTRGEMSEELKANLAKAEKEIQTYVKRRLKEFSDTHAEMSDDLKKSLAKYVGDIVDSTKKLLGEYSSDMKKAKNAWQSMASSLAKSRKGGVMPRIEAGEKVTTVEEAVKKPKKKRGRKRRK